MTWDEASDDALLVAVARGDRRAFHCLMERHARPMLALAHRVTGSREDADDVVQQSFLQVWRVAGRWTPEGRAKFSSWLYRVVLNACIDLGRRTAAVPLEEAGDPADEAPDGLDMVIIERRRRLIREVLDELPERQRKAMYLYYFGDVTVPQSAAILGITVSALESLLVRGKRTLRAALTRRGIMDIGDVS